MDHLYEDASFIFAKARPDCKLVINRYLNRIYYCYAVDDPNKKLLAYFERELISPATAGKKA